MCAADIHSFLSLKPIIYSMLLLKRGPSFSEKLKFGVGGNTLIKAKKNQSMRVDDLTETLYSISMQNLSPFSLI